MLCRMILLLSFSSVLAFVANGQVINMVDPLPLVINTWGFTNATSKAWDVVYGGGSHLDAVERGCTTCEEEQSDYTVGYGGSPDENGETTLDAMVMDGESHSVGAVGCLRRVKNAVGVARKVMEHTTHTMLVGELATQFAVKMGFKEESLTTETSKDMHEEWKLNHCQPNFWKNVLPDPRKTCGPYSPSVIESDSPTRNFGKDNHDTIGIIVIDSEGKIAAGTSSNGARNKIPGRVGDSPIAGAGCYVDRDVGAAAATGDGDYMMRFLPSLVTVEGMRSGLSPSEAADLALSRIERFYPGFMGAIVATTKDGQFGAACRGIDTFPYSVRSPETKEVTVFEAKCNNK